MKLKTLLAPLLIGALAFAIAGCGSTSNQSTQTQKEIKIGATSGPHAQVAEAVAKEAKKQGIDLKVVEFSDYVTPDKALADGDIQLNAYQHVPFMENFNKQNGSNLVAIGKTILVRMGLYSMLWCMLNIDSKLAYFIAYERRTQWTIRRCIPPYSTRSPTHFPKSKHRITATPKKHLSLPSKRQKKSISQHKTKKGAPRRGEHSNAALAGNSKTMKIRSRRRLLKTVDTQAKRQRR